MDPKDTGSDIVSENQSDVPQFSRPFGNKLVELAQINPGDTILDIGMGNGTATFFPAIEKVGKTGNVIGIDISKDMVKRTYDKIIDDNITNAMVIQTDAKSLIFKDNTFDVVLSGFSYLCCPFEELMRVLKEGGKFGLTSWEALEDMEWMASFLRKYIPVTVQDVCYCDTEEGLENLLDTAGFRNITLLSRKEEFVYTNEEQWWEEMQEGWHSYLEEMELKGLNTLKEFKKEAFKELQIHKYKDGLHCGVSALIALCTKGLSQ